MEKLMMNWGGYFVSSASISILSLAMRLVQNRESCFAQNQDAFPLTAARFAAATDRGSAQRRAENGASGAPGRRTRMPTQSQPRTACGPPRRSTAGRDATG